MPTSAHGPAGVRPLRTTIFSRSKIVTPQYAAVKGRCIAAAAPRSDAHRTGQYLPLPREQKGCSFLRTGVVPRRGQTLCPLLGVFFCFVFLHGQENEDIPHKNCGINGGSKPPPYEGVIFCALQNSAVGADSISARKLKKPHPSRLTPCHLPPGEGFRLRR